MRVCLVTHGFPPYECTGVESYTAALAGALAAAGHGVEVFAPRLAPELPDLSLRREERDGYGVTWISTNTPPSGPEEMLEVPGVAVRFGDYLDRERPEVVHFQHLIKLGVGLVEVAEQRRIPTIYTAHDYYPVCHRVTLVRPDLSRCDVVGDPARCARCDLGLAYLNRFEELGDYQLGALPSQLGPTRSAELAAVLEGDPEPDVFPAGELASLVDRRTQLDQRRLRAYARLDLVLSPTRFLVDRLAAGGLDPERLRVLTYGAEVADLRGLPRPERRRGQPLRFGYLGGLTKQKGVHVLLEAFGELGDGASLDVWGSSSDAAYVAELGERMQAVGAHPHGTFERDELARCLEQVDVVVVPSLWVENYPFVIREAFAAGRPVIASDLGALPESVRDGVDGLLVAPGDASALAAAMRRLVDEAGLLERLVEGIGPVKSIEEQATELAAIYEELLTGRTPRDDSNLPRCLQTWQARYDELSSLPQRELFRAVMERVGSVEAALLGEPEAPAPRYPYAEALALESGTQTLLRDLRRERDWLKRSVEAQQRSTEALREHLSWRESVLTQTAQESSWLRGLHREKEAECAWLRSRVTELEKEAEWLRGMDDEKSKEADWLKSRQDSLEKENQWLRGLRREKEEQESWLTDTRGKLEREASWLRGLVAARDDEVRWLRDWKETAERDLEWHAATLESQRAEIAWLRETLVSYEGELSLMRNRERRASERCAELEDRNGALREELAAKDERMRADVEAVRALLRGTHELHTRLFAEPLEAVSPDPDAALEELDRLLARGSERIHALLDEVEYRREEMDAARQAAREALSRGFLGRTQLGRRVAGWTDDDAPTGAQGGAERDGEER